MTIVRVKKDTKYFTASNEPFNDVRLSWETRGLMGYLLSKPNNWQIRMDALEKAGPAGNYKLKRMLAEARKYGYINRIRVSLDDNKFDWISEIYESPSLNPNPTPGYSKQKATGGKSTTGLPASARFSTSGLATNGKPRDIVITDSDNTELEKEEDDQAYVLELNERLIKLTKLYQENISKTIVPLMSQILMNFAKTYEDSTWYPELFKIYVSNHASSWDYIETVAANWKKYGFGSLPPAMKSTAQPSQRYAGKRQGDPERDRRLADKIKLLHAREQ